MQIIITEWALQSYLDLVGAQFFDRAFYRSTIRPDVELLRDYPADPKFQLAKFWSPVFAGGFKMKWHHVGNGQVQLRLPVALQASAILCAAYVKKSKHHEARALAKFKHHINEISQGNYTVRGAL